MSSPEAALTLEPCPFCGARLIVREHSAFHPANDCAFLSDAEIGDYDYASWNRRAQAAPTAAGKTFTEVATRFLGVGPACGLVLGGSVNVADFAALLTRIAQEATATERARCLQIAERLRGGPLSVREIADAIRHPPSGDDMQKA